MLNKTLADEDHKITAVISLLLMVTTLVVFWPTSRFDFINFDDNIYISENPHVRSGLTWNNIQWALSAELTSDSSHADLWIPVTFFSHILTAELFGMNPSAHHLVNVALHILNTVLLFWVLRRMTRDLWPSAFVAALFAIHPLHVESVAWVTERKDVLSMLFFLLTIGAYVRYIEQPHFSRYFPIICLFALGLMAKPMLVTLPIVLLLLDYWPLGRIPLHDFKLSGYFKGMGRLVWEKLPLFFLSAAFSVMTVISAQRAGATRSFEMLPLWTRIVNAFISYATYIRKMIWPTDLAVFYPYQVDSLSMWQVSVVGLLLLAATSAFIGWREKRPYWVTGWFLYLVTLLPVIGLVQAGRQAMADRYTYIPLIGVFIMLAWGIPDFVKNWRYRKILLPLAAALVLPALMICTRVQLSHWRNSITIFEHAIEVTNDNFTAHNNLGIALAADGRIEAAIAHYSEAIRINPTDERGHNNLGVAFIKQGKFEEAQSHYLEAMRLKPNYVEAYNNMAIALEKQGKIEEASEYFKETLRINPSYVSAVTGLGNLYFNAGKTQDAIEQYIHAIEITPNNADAHFNIGIALSRQRKNEEAIRHYNQAIQLKPDYADAHFNLGGLLGLQGNLQDAITQFSAFVRMKPGDAQGHYILGYALVKQGQIEEGIIHYTESLLINPSNPVAHNALGVAYNDIGKSTDAIREFEMALNLNPEFLDAQKNLSMALSNKPD